MGRRVRAALGRDMEGRGKVLSPCGHECQERQCWLLSALLFSQGLE